MQTFIALLRGINVSGHKKIKMTELKTMFEQLGFQNIVTYIQSGNVVFKNEESNVGDLEHKIKQGIQNTFGFDVTVLIKTKRDLQKILYANPFNNPEEIETKNIYFVFLKVVPEQYLVESLQQETYKNEMFAITDNCVYLGCLKGYGNAKCNNNFFEKKLKVPATTRNHRTMMKLLEISEEK